MHLVHLCSSARVGGIETSVLAMLQSLRAAEPSWAVTVIAPESGDFLDRVRRLGCDAIAVPFPPALARFGEASAARGSVRHVPALLASARYAARLRTTLNRTAPDVVHAHGIKMQVLSRLASPRRARLVWHVHDYVSNRASSLRALRAACGRCTAAVANSRSVAEDFRARVCRDVPVSVVYNAVDIDRYCPDGPRLDLDALAGLAAPRPGTVRIGLPATFGLWKGHQVFLRALSRLSADARWRAYILGGAVYQTRDSQWSLAALQAMAREHGVGDRVGFTGIVQDMPSAMRSLDIVVHASTHPEPFGMTIAEAMACGRAVAVAFAGGAAEIVHAGIDAVTYPPADDAALAGELAALIENSAERARLASQARRSATEAFDARRLGPELRRVYESVLSRN